MANVSGIEIFLTWDGSIESFEDWRTIDRIGITSLNIGGIDEGIRIELPTKDFTVPLGQNMTPGRNGNAT